MFNNRRFTYALVFLAILLALTPSRALACSGVTPSFWDGFTSATAVFTGKIISIDTNGKVTFQVLKSWKGSNDNYVVVANDPLTCGVSFTNTGTDTFLVYAYDYGDGELYTHEFTRTTSLSKAGADIMKLNIITNLVPIVLVSIAIGLIIRGIIRYFLQRRRMAQ